MANVEYGGGNESPVNCGADTLLLDPNDGCAGDPTKTSEYVCVVEPMCTPDPCARALYGCPAVPLLGPVDQLLHSATLLFVFAAWLFNSDVMLFFAFVSLCVNLCLCCGKPAVGCWMADVLIAGVLLLVLLIRDTGYVVHVVFHGDTNVTQVLVH